MGEGYRVTTTIERDGVVVHYEELVVAAPGETPFPCLRCGELPPIETWTWFWWGAETVRLWSGPHGASNAGLAFPCGCDIELFASGYALRWFCGDPHEWPEDEALE